MSYLSRLDGVEFKVLNVIYKKFFKNYWRIKDYLYLDGYIAILEYKKENPNACESDLIACVSNAMGKLAHKQFLDEDTISLEKENSKGSILSDTVHSLVGIVDSINFKYLLFLFDNFIKEYKTINIGSCNVFLDYYNGFTLSYLCNKYGLVSSAVIKHIRDFRKAFESYLISSSYLNNSIYKDDEFSFTTIEKNVNKRHYQKTNNQAIDLKTYKNDFYICELLRNSKDLTQYANCLNINVDLLERLIYHKNSCGVVKLSLYQIQKLRLNFFNNYTLEELAYSEVN